MFEEDSIFKARPINQERTEYIITVGNHLATKKTFKSEEEANNYKKEVHWDMVVALIAEMNYEFEKNLKQEKK